jgi:hypothetical protein
MGCQSHPGNDPLGVFAVFVAFILDAGDLAVLQQGLASPEQAAFVQQLSEQK